MARYQVTLDMALRWSAEFGSSPATDMTLLWSEKQATCGKNYSDRDNGALSSNTPQKACHRAKNACNTHVGSLSQSLSVPLIPSGAKEYGESMFLYTCGISIAVTIRSIDPRWG